MQTRIRQAYVAALVAGVAVRLALLALPATFTTDVTYYNAQAVGYLLRGIDPYGASYAVPPSLATAGASTVFAYLPGVFAFIAPFGALGATGAGLVFSDFVVAASLLLLGKSRPGLYSSLYLVFQPTVLFATWFPNDTLPAIALLSVALVFEARGKAMAAAPLWGLAAAASQEVWFAFPLYAYYCIHRRRYAEVLVAAGSALAVAAPFLLWNPSAFAYDTVFFQFGRQAVPLLSSGPFGLNVNPSLQGMMLSLGLSVPLAVRGALTLLALVLVVRLAGRDLHSLMLACTAFVSVALLILPGEFFWSYLELPFVTLLVWGALRPQRRQKETDEFKA